MTPEQSALQYAHHAARRTTYIFTDDFGEQIRCVYLESGLRAITTAPEQKLAEQGPIAQLVYDGWGSLLPFYTAENT
jgi:hypothetical protein